MSEPFRNDYTPSQARPHPRVSKADLDAWRTGANPESPNAKLYKAALSLLAEIEGVERQRDELADALLLVLKWYEEPPGEISLSWGEVGSAVHAALRNAGRLP